MKIINRIINKIVKKTLLWWYRHHSTLVPDGCAKYLQPVLFLGKGKVVMGDGNVFGYFPSIGNNVSICKGVHIGDNVVIANGAVVFDDVRANTIVRGNPATFYKELYE